MTARQTTTGTPADGYKVDPPPIPQPRNVDDPNEPGRRAEGGRHRAPVPPPRLTRHQVAGITAGGLAALTATIGLAAIYAPDGTPPRASAAPVAVEVVREPTGHGGLGGPLAPPTIAADLPVWEPADGPVIVAGKALPRPAAISRTVVAAPEPTELPGLPQIPPATQAAEPTPDPDPVEEEPPTPLPPLDDIEVVDVEPEPTETEQQPEQPPADPEPATEPEP